MLDTCVCEIWKSLAIPTCILRFLICSRNINLSHKLRCLRFALFGFEINFFQNKVLSTVCKNAITHDHWLELLKMTPTSCHEKRGRYGTYRRTRVCHPFPVEGSRYSFQTKQKKKSKDKSFLYTHFYFEQNFKYYCSEHYSIIWGGPWKIIR